MFLMEVVTLLLLGAVLVVKYVTITHKHKLEQRQTELENQCKQFMGRQKALKQEREAVEAEKKFVEKNLEVQEGKLLQLREAFEGQESRNRDLIEQTESM